MNTYRLFISVFAGLGICLGSCTRGLEENLDEASVSAVAGEQVTVENNVVTVERGVPVKFSIAGTPDNITFYSGEIGHNYDFRKRTTIDASQISSTKLSFKVKGSYGGSLMYEDLIHLYVSSSFGGLLKDDFAADCTALAEFADWQDLVDPAGFPKKSGEEKTFEVDMTPYLSENVTLAFHYNPCSNPDTQPKLEFTGFKITNNLLNGTTEVINAGDMGFTPVNVWTSDLSKLRETDLKDLKSQNGFFDETGNLIESAMWYGTVGNGSSGLWNTTNASNGNFTINSCAKDGGVRESWFVSDYLVINACTPDEGVSLKNITNRYDSYEYTYNETGTYKAVFVLNNANYKHEDTKLVTMIINVK